jgi:predicted DNA-binding transcriptional regulator AlpA
MRIPLSRQTAKESAMDHITKSKRYLRKAAVAARYQINVRSVERKVAAGTLPRPEYPAGGRVPLWDESVLEQHERRAVTDTRAKGPA